jgi:hypothetical protein
LSGPPLIGIKISMKSSKDDAAEKVDAHREDGEQVLRRTSEVVPIDDGSKPERVENVPPEKSNEALNDFLDEIKEKNRT